MAGVRGSTNDCRGGVDVPRGSGLATPPLPPTSHPALLSSCLSERRWHARTFVSIVVCRHRVIITCFHRRSAAPAALQVSTIRQLTSLTDSSGFHVDELCRRETSVVSCCSLEARTVRERI